MECPSCRAAVPEGSKFCNQCGAALPARCVSCGHENTSGAKFCSECGATLARASHAPAPTTITAASHASSTSIPSAERRQLTVLFCDIVGSTMLSTRLDPEDLRGIIGAYHRSVAQVVCRLDGFIAKYMGDGVLVYFGYPQAHEDDPERAVRTGLGLIDAVGQLAGPEQLQVRIGICTGDVVVGDLIGSGEAQERGIIGETPNLAARLQALAEPNSVVIAPRTQRLLGNLFEYDNLGFVAVKGFAEPVRAWRVLRPSAVESRFEALHSQAGLVPLVGRTEEMELLLRRWGQAKTGHGRLVLVSGEPGIGKSRLLAALDERLRGETLTRLRCFCSPHHQATPLHPVIRQLEFVAGFGRDDPANERLRKLRALLAETATAPDDEALLIDLLSVPSTGLPRLNFSPQRRKERTFDALIRQTEQLAAHRPVLMLFEDAHWADPSTLELMDLATPRLHERRVLVVMTFRPEFQAPWTGQAGVTLIALSRLEQAEAAQLTTQITLDQVLPSAVLSRILAQADGVPLFIEELTKAVLESRGLAAVPTGVPDTLQASLMARLDRLPPAKQVAQIGSVIGREFSHELIRTISDIAESTLTDGLDQLVASGLVLRRDKLPEATYVFKHALVQNAAYETLLRAPRAALHGAVAAALARDAEMAATQPGLLAHHYAEAGLIEQAIDYWLKAGNLALARSANAEAVTQIQKGLESLDRLSNDATRHRKETELQVALAGAFSMAKGQASLEAGAAFGRAYQLAQEFADSQPLASILWGLWLFHLNRAELKKSVEKATALLNYIHVSGDTAAESTAHRCIGISMVFLAAHDTARAHLSQALALKGYMPRDFIHEQIATTLANPIRSLQSWSLLLQGHLNEAHAVRDLALAEATQSNNPHVLAVTLHQSCVFDQLGGDRHKLEAKSAELIALTTEQGFAHWLATGTIFRGWCMATAGERERGLAEMHRGLKAKQATGSQLKIPYYLGLIAALSAETAPDYAMSLFADALTRVEQTGERWFEPELHRLRGEALLRSHDSPCADTEAEFQRALAIARDQEARFWELCASVSLARLWRAEGKRDEASELLAPIYGWFTEGFDTPDLKEAKALLDELCG
jgi:predicted ATPase/class 3 adenylate cyclase